MYACVNTTDYQGMQALFVINGVIVNNSDKLHLTAYKSKLH